MRIHNIKITNFKSIYGTKEFDFDNLQGLIKVSGPIGCGKTCLAESLLWGLYGDVKGQNNGNLVSWNQKDCSIELNITSKGKELHIIRSILEPLIVEVDGKNISASNKRNMQTILEEELYDVPKLAVLKMCIVTFSAINSLADMSPSQTKQFQDEVFGFKLFSEYNDKILIEKKLKQSERLKLGAICDEHANQVKNLKEKKEAQQRELEANTDIESFKKRRDNLISQGKQLRERYNEIDSEYLAKEKELDDRKYEHSSKKSEYATLGRQCKEWINKFRDGVCPTCGNSISQEKIESQRTEMMNYATLYKEQERLESELQEQLSNIREEKRTKLNELNNEMDKLRVEIGNIDSEIRVYNNNLKVITENFDELIDEAETKYEEIKTQLDSCDVEVAEWSDMSELFSKTLRYNLLNTLIPHINKSIQYFVNRLDLNFKVEFDQEFKPHIYVDSYEKEITYNNLSTGQKKSLDLAIVFGVLQNVISNVDLNVIFLDELFSNFDSDSRELMMTVLKDAVGEGKSVFLVNHAELADDLFSHKIQVRLRNKKIELTGKKKEEPRELVVKASQYEIVF